MSKTVLLLPGDGIGPEVTNSVVQVHGIACDLQIAIEDAIHRLIEHCVND